MSLERLHEHRRLWALKPDLRAVYEVWFDLLLDQIPEGARVLEVGSGPGLLAEAARERRPDLRWISSDLLVAPWNDVAADAGQLPFVTGGVDAVLGIDVLHHLPRPAALFQEAARVLGGRGELRLVEPWITPLGWVIYRFLHQEDCRLRFDRWAPFPGPKDAFDGNAAVPWRLVRDTPAWEWRHLGVEAPRRRRLNTFAYLLTLGFRPRSLLHPGLVRSLLALDRWTRPLSALVGLRALLVWPSASAGRALPVATDAPPPPVDETGPKTGAPPDSTGSPRRSGGRRAALVGLVLLAVVAAIVAFPRWGPSPRWEIHRLLPEPESEMDQTELYEEVEIRRISFTSEADAARWTHAGGHALGVDDGALALAPEQAVHRIIGPLGEDAEAVDVIEVEVEQESPSGVALLWPRADGRFVSDRAVGRLPDANGVARFVLASHPRWRGRVERIAVQPSFSRQRVRVRGVRLLGWRLSTEKALRAPREARAVELRGDRRAGVAVVEGRPATRTLDVPPRAHLRFGLGLPEYVPASARFELGLRLPGGAEETLLEYEARSGGRQPGWSEHEVDLGPWTGRTVELSLRISGIGPDPAPVGFWSNLQLRVPATGPRRPSVLLISADTLRADHLSLYGYRRSTSPHLDRWAERRGVVFLNAVAPSPWTLPSHVSLLTGVDAHRHGVSRQGPIPAEIPTLAELFREAGYLTLASTGGGLVARRFGFGRGFDVYRSRENEAPPRPGGELAQGVDEVLQWLARHAEEPVFLFFHTYETHTPLEPREPFFTRLRGRSGPLPDRPLNAEPVPSRADDGFRQRYRFAWTTPLLEVGEEPPPPPPGLDLDDPQLALDLYDSTIANLDAAVGRMLGRLEELGQADETLVVFTSDHGESFGENGFFAHTHLQDSNLMVPLVVSPRPRGGPREVEVQVRLVDVAPTLLELAGIPPPAGVQGRSLVPLMTGTTTKHPEVAWSYAARTNRGLGLRVANRWKLIVPNTVWPGARGRDELYDMGADPGESRNLAGQSEALAELRSLARDELARIPQGVTVVARCEEAPCFEGRLTGLGSQRYGVTSPDLDCACVEPVDGGTRLSIGEGDAFTLVYEDVVEGELGLDLESTGPSSARVEIRRPVGPGQPPFALRRGASGWQVVEEPSETPRVGLHVSYRGPSTRPRPEVAREMEERLRALGYIE